MREIVIVIADLFLPSGGSAAISREPSPRPLGEATGGPQPLGLTHAVRYGTQSHLALGWRAWLADWLGSPELGDLPPAQLAALARDPCSGPRGAWLAAPLHLIAGLRELHVHWGSLLRVPERQLHSLTQEFAAAFGATGLTLTGLSESELLLSGFETPAVTTHEPARSLALGVAAALPRGAGSARLRQLSSEIELWLHGTRLNAERAASGAPLINALWLWGGGGAAPLARAAPTIVPPDRAAVAFASTAWVQGLCRQLALECLCVPPLLDAVLSYSRAARGLIVLEISGVLHARRDGTLLEALSELDRRFIAPAVRAVRTGRLERLTVMANDRRITLEHAHRWRLWRRPRTALESLR